MHTVKSDSIDLRRERLLVSHLAHIACAVVYMHMVHQNGNGEDKHRETLRFPNSFIFLQNIKFTKNKNIKSIFL